MSRLLVTLFLWTVSVEALAAEPKLRSVREYCTVMEQSIVGLAMAQTSLSADAARYLPGQSTANTNKFKEAEDHLRIVTLTLKEREEEWARLSCAHILYPRPK